MEIRPYCRAINLSNLLFSQCLGQQYNLKVLISFYIYPFFTLIDPVLTDWLLFINVFFLFPLIKLNRNVRTKVVILTLTGLNYWKFALPKRTVSFCSANTGLNFYWHFFLICMLNLIRFRVINTLLLRIRENLKNY